MTTSEYDDALLQAYHNLTFQLDDDNAEDLARAASFKRLVQLHLRKHNITTKQQLNSRTDVAAHQCILDFMQTYAKTLWPNSEASRAHLRPYPGYGAKKEEKGFYWEHDSRMPGQQRASFKSRTGSDPSPADEAWLSRIGTALRKYWKVLLTEPLGGNAGGDAAALVKEIVGVDSGSSDGEKAEYRVKDRAAEREAAIGLVADLEGEDSGLGEDDRKG